MSGFFIMATPDYGFPAYGLWSPLAISHGNSAVFGFTDGHAEIRKWHDSIVFEHYLKTEKSYWYGQTYAPKWGGRSEDLDWVVKGWAYRDR
jgi:prepilin-type processing-associated H-X9-DG protein